MLDAENLPVIVVVVGSDPRPDESLIRRLLPDAHRNNRVQYEHVDDPGDVTRVQLDWAGGLVYATRSASNPLASRYDITVIPRVIDDVVVTALCLYREADSMLREYHRTFFESDTVEAFITQYVNALEMIERRLDKDDDHGLDYLAFILNRRLIRLLSTFDYFVSGNLIIEGTFFGVDGVRWDHGNQYTVYDWDAWQVFTETVRSEYGYILYPRARINGHDHVYAVHRRRDHSLVLLGPKVF